MSIENQNTSPKPTGKKASSLSQKEQSQRFQELAKDLEIQDDDSDFEELMDVIVSQSNCDKPEKPK